jgi:hypothetical protein
MAYRVDKFNGTFLVSVEDGTIDTTTDIRFIGKNYAGYGEVQNENFLHLLENFANTSPPPKSVIGQIWYDSSLKKLKFYDGNQFKTASGAVASGTAPSGLTAGDFWYDTSADQLYAFNGAEFILVGPENTPEVTATALVSAQVKDNTNADRAIIKVQVNSETIAVISGAAFTLNTSINPISGFGAIRKGFTLINSDNVSGVTTTDHYFWGTSSNTARFSGRPVTDFVLQSQLANYSDAGIIIGDQNDLKIWVENGDSTTIENQIGNTITMRIRTGLAAVDKKDVAVFGQSSIRPGIPDFFDLGSTVDKWQNVYSNNLIGNIKALDTTTSFNASTKEFFGIFRGDVLDENGTLSYDYETGTFYGDFVGGSFIGTFNGPLNGNATSADSINGVTAEVNAVPSSLPVRDGSGNLIANRFTGTADKADELKVGAAYRTASVTADPNTVAVRDASGNLAALLFQGTATAAQYADLAEKYLADAEYEVGTVVCIGGEKEITAATYGNRAIGAVSGKPGFIMNSDLEGGTLVALKGRVPVKVQGTVKKGDKLVPAQNMFGAASSADKSDTDYFAIALQDHQTGSAGVIEALIL